MQFGKLLDKHQEHCDHALFWRDDTTNNFQVVKLINVIDKYFLSHFIGHELEPVSAM